jgi:hypothetical protein
MRSAKEVIQGTFDVAGIAEDLFTDGMGPCLGVAVVHAGTGYLLHADVPPADVPRFLDRLSQIPRADRAQIRPILAGCRLRRYFRNQAADAAANADTLRDRKMVELGLINMGFALPQKHWAASDEVDELSINADSGDVTLKIGPADDLSTASRRQLVLRCQTREAEAAARGTSAISL